MAYTKYSLTPANNTATPPDGAPEGMLPSAVNDTMRDMMAQIRDVGDGIRDGTYTMTAAKITGGTITGVTMTASSVSATSLTDSGNLTFTGTGNRITGDFSNATPANRVMFQNSTTNTNTLIGAIPNGTGSLGVFEAFSSSDPTNSSNIRIRASTTEGRLESSITGTGTYLPLTMFTGGSERLRITTGGDVCVGNTAALADAAGRGNITINGSSSAILSLGTGAALRGYLFHTGTDMVLQNSANGYLAFSTNATERMRITSGGDVGIGATAPSGARCIIKTPGVDATSELALSLNHGDSGLSLDQEIRIGFGQGDAATNQLAQIASSYTGGTFNGDLRFRTNNSGTVAERMRISSGGSLLIGTTDAAFTAKGTVLAGNGQTNMVADGATILFINRLTNDGKLVAFYQASVEEGDISVAGTTVSYNGGHLARYAQTTAPKDETIVKGTVLSNLDEMNQYVDKKGNPVANEQLNKVKVSDVEGDVNVAGVFVNWAYDEAHNVDEINMAMTGDMIIRIAEGVVVQKGDLLMSAGDGTAKPQGDDIVRSKTVAKVTSNHVTCTYADGSYCVPCVLMAC